MNLVHKLSRPVDPWERVMWTTCSVALVIYLIVNALVAVL